MFGCDCCYINTFIYGVGALTIASKVIPFLLGKLKGEKPFELQQKDYKKDVVYFYQFPGSPTASSTSPFCIKIESFLRLHNIKFERHNTVSARGRNGKVPFIELNGEQHADSQIIIRRLTQIFHLKTYPEEQSAAIGHAVDRLLDNHTFNLLGMAKHKAAHKVIEFIAGVNGVPSFLMPIISRLGGSWLANMTMERAATSIGKFTESEYNELLRNDLVQLQRILGTKQFMLGDEPTTVDCTALGQFGFAFYAIPAARFCLHDLLESSEFAPLREYLERVKTRIFGNEFFDKL